MHVKRDQLLDPEEVEPEASAVAVYEAGPRLRSGVAPLAQDGFEPCQLHSCNALGTCLTNNLSLRVRARLHQPFDGFTLYALRPFPRRERSAPSKENISAGQVSRLLRKCRARKQILKLRELIRSFLDHQDAQSPAKEIPVSLPLELEIALGGVPAKLPLPNSISPKMR